MLAYSMKLHGLEHDAHEDYIRLTSSSIGQVENTTKCSKYKESHIYEVLASTMEHPDNDFLH